MRCIFAIIIFLLFGSIILHAQPDKLHKEVQSGSVALGAQNQQDKNRRVVQFTGIVVDNQNLSPISYVNISVKNSYRGTISNNYGYFSFVAYAGDEIVFSGAGFKTVTLKIPDTSYYDRYSIVQSMTKDSLELEEVVIYPWPTKEKFAEAFINLKIPDDDYEIARKNVAFAELRERANASSMSASMNYKYFMQQKVDQLYYAGQYMPNNLLNPMAWAKFLELWKQNRETTAKQKKEEGYDPD